MRSNQGMAQKLLGQSRRQRRRTDTPRTDNFVATMPALVLDEEDFTDRDACVRTMIRLREQMIGWAEFARQLERELNQSIPKEWRQ